MKIEIDKELRSLIPPLTDEERHQLEQNLLEYGCRDPLVVWTKIESDKEYKHILVDGHNRLEICAKHGIKYEVEEMEFDGFRAAKLWMIDNQKGRRNLTDGWKFELAQSKKALLLEVGREKQVETLKQFTNLPVISNIDKTEGDVKTIHSLSDISNIDTTEPQPTHNTQAAVAKDLGWSTGKVAMADKVWKQAPQEVKDKVKSGEVSVGGAYDFVKAKEIKPDLEFRPESAKQSVTQAKAVIEEEKKKHVHVAQNSGNNEWYTPANFIEAARVVMGTIDVDPASNDIAQQTVKAGVYYTAENSGLTKEWRGNVWMNPPYASPLIGQFCERLRQQVDAGNVHQACVLVNNATETKWFADLVQCASAIVFTKGRVRFLDQQGNPGGAPLQGQAVVYIGANAKQFTEAFSGIGWGCYL